MPYYFKYETNSKQSSPDKSVQDNNYNIVTHILNITLILVFPIYPNCHRLSL